jgi:hypothetical protein
MATTTEKGTQKRAASEGARQALAGKLENRARKRGVVMVEYSTLLLIVGIPASIGMVLGGLALAQQYAATRQTILNSNP